MKFYKLFVALVHWLQNAKEILQDLQIDHCCPLFVSDDSVTSSILEFVWETINDPVIIIMTLFLLPYLLTLMFILTNLINVNYQISD